MFLEILSAEVTILSDRWLAFFGTWFQKLRQHCISFVKRRNLNLIKAIFLYASWIFLDMITWAEWIDQLPSSVLSSPAHGLFKSMFFTIGVLLSLFSASSSKSSGISSAPLRSSGRISLLFRVKKVVRMLYKVRKIIFPSFCQYKTIWIDMYYWWCIIVIPCIDRLEVLWDWW